MNWFEKLPPHWRYIIYMVTGIIIGGFLCSCLTVEVEFDQEALEAEINRIVELHIRELGEDLVLPDTFSICIDGFCQTVIIKP